MRVWYVALTVVILMLGMGAGASATCCGDNADEPTLAELVFERQAEALEAGDYNCCLNNPCIQCLVHMGACTCGENLVNGEPVCHECKGGWEAGDGAIDDVDPSDVQVMPRGM